MPTPPLATVSSLGLAWEHPFAALGPDFFAAVQPTPVPAPYRVAHNPALGQALGLAPDWWKDPGCLQALAGNALLEGSAPLASVYSGHQFGVWAGQLGDGRALLLGQAAGMEWQLKGAGRTPFSRSGDGRAVLRSSIREFLACEAMHALGIPSTRALYLAGSDLPVYRETAETAAVLTRLAPSFVRFGHFEHFCHTDQHAALRQLADDLIARSFPDLAPTTAAGGNPYAALLAEVAERTADLVAQWQSVGFCHGVLNTDNLSVLGLTLDYGPFQFLDAYQPGHICNHSDTQGRYAFDRQPAVAYWNLLCLGQALMPLIGQTEQALEAVDRFKTRYPQALAACFARKLGLDHGQAVPPALLASLLELLAREAVDYTLFWRRLSHWLADAHAHDPSVRSLFQDTEAIDRWLADFAALHPAPERAQAARRMLAVNPKYVLRNYLAETVIQAAQRKDFGPLQNLLQVLQSPCDEHPDHAAWAEAPPAWAADIALSCSS